MTISVVVPVYQMREHLDRCVSSLLAQTLRDYELLLVDDGSTDGGGELCDAWAARDARVRAVHKPNGGLSSARNRGIDEARGRYIIFPDPDDWTEPTYLEHLLALRERERADVSICGHYLHQNGADQPWNPSAAPVVFNSHDALDALLRPNAFCGFAWNKLYDMEVIRAHALRFDEELGMAQDLHFAVRYFLLCERIAYDPAPLYHYNKDSGGVTVADRPLTPRSMSAILTYEKIAAIVREIDPALETTAYSCLCRLCLVNIRTYYRCHMKDRAILRTLQRTVVKHRDSFLRSDAYSPYQKRFSWLVALHPRAYVTVYPLYTAFIHARERARGK